MSYQEKRTIASMFSGFIVLVAYCIYALQNIQSTTVESSDVKFWAGSMLMFIGIGIVITIVIQIIFHILNSIGIAVKERNSSEKEIDEKINLSMVEDEMDKLIELKSIRAGYIFSGIGFVLALISIVLNYSVIIMLNIIFLSYFVGTLLEGFTNLYYYKKGIKSA